MIEKQAIDGKDVWIRVDPHPVQRSNPHIIPREYFTATCFRDEPGASAADGENIKDENGETKLFESPVAALTFARKFLEGRR